MTVTNCTTGSVRIKGGQKQLLVTRKIYKKKLLTEYLCTYL